MTDCRDSPRLASFDDRSGSITDLLFRVRPRRQERHLFGVGLFARLQTKRERVTGGAIKVRHSSKFRVSALILRFKARFPGQILELNEGNFQVIRGALLL
jgi:hypothetical protein